MAVPGRGPGAAGWRSSRELAAQLGAREVVDARDPVASVHGVLAAFPAGWLLVFDNAAGPGGGGGGSCRRPGGAGC